MAVSKTKHLAFCRRTNGLAVRGGNEGSDSESNRETIIRT